MDKLSEVNDLHCEVSDVYCEALQETKDYVYKIVMVTREKIREVDKNQF